MYDDVNVTPGSIAPWIIIPATAILIVVVLYSVVFAHFDLWNLNWNTQQIHASNGYVNGIQTELSTDALDYNRLSIQIQQDSASPATVVALQTQQSALLNQMHIDAAKIPQQDVPENVRQLLASQ